MTWVSFCIYHCYDLLEYDNNNYGFFLYFDVAENKSFNTMILKSYSTALHSLIHYIVIFIYALYSLIQLHYIESASDTF